MDFRRENADGMLKMECFWPEKYLSDEGTGQGTNLDWNMQALLRNLSGWVIWPFYALICIVGKHGTKSKLWWKPDE